ncbi:HalOD1 output domain-containing protein [Haloarculaceae archaeon H-GB2-1]|nr:hypothetical protein [Haloarculaceae archaeon H-GB1-1]MEA5406712.1 HalOD1 output domain-containing protein [Haloarculaceae archaeon H-GB2-1]
MSDGPGRSRDATPISVALPEAVAAAKGVDVLSLPPLSTEVDLEALDDLVESSGDELRISFDIRGLRIEVAGDGSVRVE